MIHFRFLHRAARTVRKLALIWLAMAVLAPAAHAAIMTKFLGRSTIYIVGPLQTGEDEEFAGMVDDKVERVVITSTDGSESVALNIGRLIRDKHINVEVMGKCTGACAHYIFVAGAKRSMSKGSVVGLWAGDTLTLKLILADLQSATPLGEEEAEWRRALIQQYSAILAFQSSNKAAFERDVGLDNSIVSQFETVTAWRGMNIYAVTAQGFKFKASKGLCDVWVPDRSGWQALGITVADFVRPSIETIARKLDTQPGRVSVAPGHLDSPNAAWCENQTAPVEQELPSGTGRIEPIRPRPP